MNTPPKAVCHSCGGTGIDPTVGFLDCEFCTPATTGISLSAPEQPEPKCATCNGHGEIGCLRPDGYDGEPCPECTPEPGKGVMDAVLHWRLKHAVANRKCSALQERLNAADQAVDDMVTLLNLAENILGEHRQISPGYDWINNTQQDREEMRTQIAEYLINMCAPAAEKCKFPQSCTTRCDCDIPDFSPGNGNKARRRAEAIGSSAFSDANEPPCSACFARGCNGECSCDGAMGD